MVRRAKPAARTGGLHAALARGRQLTEVRQGRLCGWRKCLRCLGRFAFMRGARPPSNGFVSSTRSGWRSASSARSSAKPLRQQAVRLHLHQVPRRRVQNAPGLGHHAVLKVEDASWMGRLGAVAQQPPGADKVPHIPPCRQGLGEVRARVQLAACCARCRHRPIIAFTLTWPCAPCPATRRLCAPARPQRCRVHVLRAEMPNTMWSQRRTSAWTWCAQANGLAPAHPCSADGVEPAWALWRLLRREAVLPEPVAVRGARLVPEGFAGRDAGPGRCCPRLSKLVGCALSLGTTWSSLQEVPVARASGADHLQGWHDMIFALLNLAPPKPRSFLSGCRAWRKAV